VAPRINIQGDAVQRIAICIVCHTQLGDRSRLTTRSSGRVPEARHTKLTAAIRFRNRDHRLRRAIHHLDARISDRNHDRMVEVKAGIGNVDF